MLQSRDQEGGYHLCRHQETPAAACSLAACLLLAASHRRRYAFLCPAETGPGDYQHAVAGSGVTALLRFGCAPSRQRCLHLPSRARPSVPSRRLPQIPLRAGPSERTVTILVTAADGVSSGRYTLTVRKGVAGDSDALLASLQVSIVFLLRFERRRLRRTGCNSPRGATVS